MLERRVWGGENFARSWALGNECKGECRRYRPMQFNPISSLEHSSPATGIDSRRSSTSAFIPDLSGRKKRHNVILPRIHMSSAAFVAQFCSSAYLLVDFSPMSHSFLLCLVPCVVRAGFTKTRRLRTSSRLPLSALYDLETIGQVLCACAWKALPLSISLLATSRFSYGATF